MEYFFVALSLIVGYLIGNIETAVIISRAVFKDDVRQHGSGNAGTTNMLRVFGMKPGIVTFFGDFAKGIAAVLIGRLILSFLNSDAVVLGADFVTVGGYAAGLGAILGHDFPVFFGFQGGKGVACSLAVAYMIAPIIAAIVTVVAFIIIYATQMVSVGSLIGITLFCAATVIHDIYNIPIIVLCVIIWLLIMIRHRDNIIRIFKGEESKLFSRPKRQRGEGYYADPGEREHHCRNNNPMR